jgi:preprotein translocase SecE subunit
MKNNIFKNIIGELKKTKWPKWKQVGILTIYTLIVCGIITLLILGLDLVLYKIRDWFLNV